MNSTAGICDTSHRTRARTLACSKLTLVPTAHINNQTPRGSGRAHMERETITSTFVSYQTSVVTEFLPPSRCVFSVEGFCTGMRWY